MDARLSKARRIAIACLAGALIVGGPWVGWWTLPVIAGVAVAWVVIDRRVKTSAKPEWLLALGWLLSCVAIAAGAWFTGRIDSQAKSWLLVPAMALPTRFHRRGLRLGIVIVLLMLLLVTVGDNPSEAVDKPQLVLFPAALIAATLAMSMALRSAEIEHRADSVIDPLTGMLNRKALEARTVELELQSRINGQPVGLIVCDIDHFKGVNDEHGHAMGDAVLKDFAYRLRKELRAYDLAYRLGGEEFIVLVPGATVSAAEELAERLRAAIAAAPAESIGVTASFGVAASGEEGLEFKSLFEKADAALYQAKADGRNRVLVAGAAAAAAAG